MGAETLARARHLLREHSIANPVAVREFRRMLRGRRAPYFVIGYLLLLIALAIAIQAGVGDLGPLNLAQMRQTLAARGFTAGPQTGLLLFTVIVVAQGYALWLLLVATLAPSFPRERESHTHDELRATMLTPWQLVSGRLCLALALTLLLMALGLPFLAVAFVTGGLAPAQLGATLLVLFTLAAFCAAVALMAGVESRGTTQAMLFAFLFTFLLLSFFIIGPHWWAPELLAIDAEVLLIVTAIYLPPALLLFALARERLADWNGRGRGFRFLLLLISCCIPVFAYCLETVQGSFGLSDLRGSFFTGIVLHLGAVLLFCGRAPAPEQVRLPFTTALRRALSPRDLLREDPLGLPLYLVLLQGLSAVVHAVIAIGMGWPDLALFFSVFTVAQVAVMLAYGGMMKLLALALRPPGYFGVVVMVMFVLQGVIIFMFSASHGFNSAQNWLSPVLYMAEYDSWDDLIDHFGEFALLLSSHGITAVIAWGGLHQSWEYARLGHYALRTGSVRD